MCPLLNISFGVFVLLYCSGVRHLKRTKPDPCNKDLFEVLNENRFYGTALVFWDQMDHSVQSFSFNFSYYADDGVLLPAPPDGRREGHREWVRLCLGRHVPHLLFKFTSFSRVGGSNLG